jgi:hypothetical protein
MCSIPTPF